MNRVILIKYGELTTKKGNRNFFVNTLFNNISDKLKNYNVKISKDRSRMYIEFNDNELEEIKKIIDKVFGIHMYHIAYIVNTNIDDISTLLALGFNLYFLCFFISVPFPLKFEICFI